MPFFFVIMPLVSIRLLSMLLYSVGKSDPTTPTTEVLVKKLDESAANVAAPPMMLICVLKGVLVVSSAMLPNTVNTVKKGSDDINIHWCRSIKSHN